MIELQVMVSERDSLILREKNRIQGMIQQNDILAKMVEEYSTKEKGGNMNMNMNNSEKNSE